MSSGSFSTRFITLLMRKEGLSGRRSLLCCPATSTWFCCLPRVRMHRTSLTGWVVLATSLSTLCPLYIDQYLWSTTCTGSTTSCTASSTRVGSSSHKLLKPPRRRQKRSMRRRKKQRRPS
eukprot:Rmarinus@m.1064